MNLALLRVKPYIPRKAFSIRYYPANLIEKYIRSGYKSYSSGGNLLLTASPSRNFGNNLQLAVADPNSGKVLGTYTDSTLYANLAQAGWDGKYIYAITYNGTMYLYKFTPTLGLLIKTTLPYSSSYEGGIAVGKQYIMLAGAGSGTGVIITDKNGNVVTTIALPSGLDAMQVAYIEGVFYAIDSSQPYNIYAISEQTLSITSSGVASYSQAISRTGFPIVAINSYVFVASAYIGNRCAGSMVTQFTPTLSAVNYNANGSCITGASINHTGIAWDSQNVYLVDGEYQDYLIIPLSDLSQSTYVSGAYTFMQGGKLTYTSYIDSKYNLYVGTLDPATGNSKVFPTGINAGGYTIYSVIPLI